MNSNPTPDPTHGLSVQQADALWDAVAIPGPQEPTFPVQHERVCRAVAGILDELAPAAPSAVDQTTRDRIAEAPVKQRADCTELEWAEQERARFERLYTRESARADKAEQRAETAARDADIYQQRLERLGEGYTRERKRAERAEAEAERLRTYRDATCICQHTEQQHFEDACLVCDCGDYLVPEAAREVIARWREAAQADEAQQPAVGARQPDTETQQQPETEAAHSCGNCEGIDPDSCLTNLDRPAVKAQQAATKAPDEAPDQWCKCRSCWGWFVEEHPGEDLDELGKDLGWWSGLPVHRDAPAAASAAPGRSAATSTDEETRS